MKLANFMGSTTRARVFKYTRYETTLSSDGERKILILWLRRPIPNVRGSQEPGGIPLTAKNVKCIYIAGEEANGRIFPKDKCVKFPQHWLLDVSRQGRVWITEQSFAKYAAKMRTELRRWK